MKKIRRILFFLPLLGLLGCEARVADTDLFHLTVTPEEFRNNFVTVTPEEVSAKNPYTQSILAFNRAPEAVKSVAACDFSSAEAIYESYCRQTAQTDANGQVWYPDSVYVDRVPTNQYFNVKRLLVYDEATDSAYGYYDNGDLAFAVEGAQSESAQTTLYAYGYDANDRRIYCAWRGLEESVVSFSYLNYNESGHVFQEYRYPVQEEKDDRILFVEYGLNYVADGSYFYFVGGEDGGYTEYYFYSDASASCERSYDKRGFLLREERWDLAGRQTYLFEEDAATGENSCIQRAYDDEGNCISKHVYENEMLIAEEQYEYGYDEEGRILTMDVYVEETLSVHYDYFYLTDAAGRVTQAHRTGSDGSTQQLLSRVYRFE